ncbi:MAG: DUF937 domain-containing protein [Spirosomataceae bacterium]
MNLFASLKEVLTEELASQIATQNNEKPEKVQKAIDTLSASIVGGLIKRVTTESGMKLVFSQIQKSEFELSQLNKVLKNQVEIDALKLVGEKNFNILLPGLKSPVSSLAAKYAGTRNSLTSSLCGITMSIVMSVLKNKINDQKLEEESLAAYLGDQREGILNAVPVITDKLIESIGIQSLLENFTVPKTEPSSSIIKEVEGQPSSAPFLTIPGKNDSNGNLQSSLKWIGIGILVIGVVGAGIYFWKQQQNKITLDSELLPIEAKTIEEPIQKDTLNTATTPAVPTPVTTTDNPMAKYLADSSALKGKAFKFENVDFEDNTTQLKPTANAPVQALAELLKKYPNAQVKLTGYANDAQSPMTNKTLSVKRVFALKDEFIKAGISYIRVDAEGRGTGINPKDTTGRKQVAMREVWVKFVYK